MIRQRFNSVRTLVLTTSTLVLLAFASPSVCDAVLISPGDIAFTGFNADGVDDLAFVTLVNIGVGETIFFSDDEWDGISSWSDTDEANWSWTPSAPITAGTIVTLNGLAGVYSGAATSNLGTVTGVILGAENAGIGNSNEAIFAYLGSAETPTAFLAMISNDGESGANFSLTNTGLSEAAGTAIVFTGDPDGMRYIGARSGETAFSGYLDNLADITINWETVGGGDGTSYIPFSDTPFTVAVPEPASVVLVAIGVIAIAGFRRRG